MILLDTDILIDCLRGYPPAKKFIESHKSITITPFSKNELFLGARNKKDFEDIWAKTNFPLIWLHNDMVDLAMSIIEKHYLKNGIDHTDAWNAAAAILYRIPLYTRNAKHYRDIDGLEMIIPY